MRKLYISHDLGTNSSGGIVTKQELLALESLQSVDRLTNLGGDNVIQLGNRDINPTLYNLPDIPFMVDYLTMEKVSQLDLDNIDLAHFYSTSYTNTIRYLKAKGIKTTITCAAHDRRESINEFENLGYQYPFEHIKNDRLWKIFSGDIREADLVITPSKSSAKFLRNEGCKKVEIISHGVDISDESIIKPLPEEFRCGYLGALGPDKGLKYLIQGWEFLNYSDSRLIVAGSQSESLEPFIRQLNPRAKYHLAGFIPNIADFYNYISVYVQPSVVEGFGMEVLEAMSYGRPVICSDGAGAADAISDGEDGFVVPKRNPEAIAEKIKYFRNNPNEIERMGKLAREKAKNYNWQIIRQKYRQIWKELLNK